MKIQYGEFVRRPFQALFESADYHLEESKQLHQKVHAQSPIDPKGFDQILWGREKAASRAAFIMGMAGIEAFANNVLRDFKVRDKDSLKSIKLTRDQESQQIDRWSLVEKVYFLPTLCNLDFKIPEFYIKRLSREFELFEELVKIRNSIMHGRPSPFKVRITFKPNNIHELHDDYPENFWPISKIARDFTSFNYQCAKTAYDNIKWVRDSLVNSLEKVDEEYMKEQKIHLKGPILEVPDIVS